jgi:hypothetical protein
VSCNRSSQHKSAPKERHNVAHGQAVGWGTLPLPLPSPARAGEGCRRWGEGLRTQGSHPGLRYSAASRLSNRTLEAREFINELRLQDTNGALPQPNEHVAGANETDSFTPSLPLRDF